MAFRTSYLEASIREESEFSPLFRPVQEHLGAPKPPAAAPPGSPPPLDLEQASRPGGQLLVFSQQQQQHKQEDGCAEIEDDSEAEDGFDLLEEGEMVQAAAGGTPVIPVTQRTLRSDSCFLQPPPNPHLQPHQHLSTLQHTQQDLHPLHRTLTPPPPSLLPTSPHQRIRRQLFPSPSSSSSSNHTPTRVPIVSPRPRFQSQPPDFQRPSPSSIGLFSHQHEGSGPVTAQSTPVSSTASSPQAFSESSQDQPHPPQPQQAWNQRLQIPSLNSSGTPSTSHRRRHPGHAVLRRRRHSSFQVGSAPAGRSVLDFLTTTSSTVADSNNNNSGGGGNRQPHSVRFHDQVEVWDCRDDHGSIHSQQMEEDRSLLRSLSRRRNSRYSILDRKESEVQPLHHATAGKKRRFSTKSSFSDSPHHHHHQLHHHLHPQQPTHTHNNNNNINSSHGLRQKNIPSSAGSSHRKQDSSFSASSSSSFSSAVSMKHDSVGGRSFLSSWEGSENSGGVMNVVGDSEDNEGRIDPGEDGIQVFDYHSPPEGHSLHHSQNQSFSTNFDRSPPPGEEEEAVVVERSLRHGIRKKSVHFSSSTFLSASSVAVGFSELTTGGGADKVQDSKAGGTGGLGRDDFTSPIFSSSPSFPSAFPPSASPSSGSQGLVRSATLNLELQKRDRRMDGTEAGFPQGGSMFGLHRAPPQQQQQQFQQRRQSAHHFSLHLSSQGNPQSLPELPEQRNVLIAAQSAEPQGSNGNNFSLFSSGGSEETPNRRALRRGRRALTPEPQRSNLSQNNI